MARLSSHLTAFLLLYYSALVGSFINDNIFRGVEDLDQDDLVESIQTDGDVLFGGLPYVVAVFNALWKYQTCTGAIIGVKMVLTAGYCVSVDKKVVEPVYVSVLAGVVDMKDRDSDQWRYAKRIVVTTKTYKDEKILALIKVSKPFFMNYSTRMASLRGEIYSYSANCRAVTWRFHEKLGRVTLKSLVLKQYTVIVLNQTYCMMQNEWNPLLYRLGDLKYLCLSFIPSVSAMSQDHECVGVSGSAIFCDDVDGAKFTGISLEKSGKSQCNRADIPYLFIDIGSEYKWIEAEMKKLLSD